MDELNAIQRLKHNDIRGLEWIVNTYHQATIQVAYLITGDLPLAEDVVQDAFLNVYRSIRSFDANRPFKPWLMRSVTNLAIQRAEKQARHISLESGSEEIDFTQFVSLDEDTPEQQLISAETKAKVWEAIQCLSPRQREAVVQRYYLDLNEKQMAETRDVAPGTIKWLLNQARGALKAILNS